MYLSMKKSLWIFTALLFALAGELQAQKTTSFNFSRAAQPVSGWVNIYGDPSVDTVDVTDSITGFHISSITPANWAPFGIGCSYDGGGAAGGTFFPAAVMLNQWSQFSDYYALYNAAMPQFKITGLNVDSVYTFKMTGSFDDVNDLNKPDPTRFTVAGTTVYGFVDVNAGHNTANGAVFSNIAPDATGAVRVYVNTYGGSTLASINGLQIIEQRSAAVAPVVAFTYPANKDELPELGNIDLTASASETGGTIVKVEFYVDNTLLGSDSVSPYTMSWIDPPSGKYALKARAIDGTGNASTATINVSIESLGSFWSTTGNIATGGDSNFLGTVDTNRLAFRTNNVERMSMSKDGNFTVGGQDTASHPAFRVYKNGDIVAGTTMEKSVHTNAQVGLKYYSKGGILQIGGSDKLDTTQSAIAYGIWPTSALIINSDDSNSIKGKLMNTVWAGLLTTLDSGVRMESCFIGTESCHFYASMGTMLQSIIQGFAINVSAETNRSIISGGNLTISKPTNDLIMSGYMDATEDSTAGVIVNGSYNKCGGIGQLLSGEFLVNRTPNGTTLGNANVDFSSLPYTGFRANAVPNLDQYPLLALGNGSNANGTVHSNAMTMLYNGRTQINTTGFTNQLTQANVTPAAALDIVSTNTGVLLPRLTNAQRNAIVTGDLKNGLLLYNTDSSLFQYYNGSAWNSVGSGTGSSKWIFSSSTNGTVYDSTDNVGIGTSDTKGYKLAVNGSAIFTSVKVKPIANWPDYVFRKGYQLPGLGELEQYIQKYNHLPGIIAGREVQRNGLDVGENQAAILKKVEELTLYLIEENKQLKMQNAKLADQDKKTEDLQRQVNELKALLLKK